MNNENNKQDAAHALLGVISTDGNGQAVGAEPSDEELASYYEGGLNETRRAQILSYISNDPNVYTRWLSLVELGDLLSLKEPLATTQSEQQKESLFARISSLFFSRMFLSGVSFASVALVIVALQFNSKTPSITNIYADYGELSSDIKVTLPTRSFSPFAAPPKPGDVVLSEGVYQGLKQLDKTMWFEDLHRYKFDVNKMLTDLDEVEAQLLLELGAWSAISFAYCHSGKDDFFTASTETVQAIITNLSEVGTQYSSQLVKSLKLVDHKGSVRTSTCKLAEAVLKRVR
jgi:hypothetical protein